VLDEAHHLMQRLVLKSDTNRSNGLLMLTH